MRSSSQNLRIDWLAVIFAGMLLPACVSDTLSTQGSQPTPLAEQNTPSYDPAQREQAIAEIREKAAQSGSGELTNAYAVSDGPNEPLTPNQQASTIDELENSIDQNNNTVSDAELAAKQQSIRELQGQAQSHYDNAVVSIKN